MTETINIQVPLIPEGAVKGHVTHNTGMTLIDWALLGSLNTITTTNTPLGSPVDGDARIIGGAPTGAWAGHASEIAVYLNGWHFIVPIEGLQLWAEDTNKQYVYDGSAYQQVYPSGGGGSTPTGTGFRHVTGGVEDAAAKLVDTADINNAQVTLAKMADLAQDLFIGRTTASTGVPQTATITAAARTVLDDTTVAAMVDTLGGASSTGSGGLARETSPAFVTPALGTPASGNDRNLASHGADVASSGTIDLDAATGVVVDVTGTTNITAITLADGKRRICRFTGALTLTNGASLVLPGGANLTTVAGDYAIFAGYAAGVVRCVAFAPGKLPIALGGTGAVTAGAAATALGVGTGDSPQFTAVNVGHATDTTVDRASAGDIQVEGNRIFRVGGTDVPVADGGTGQSSIIDAMDAFHTKSSDIASAATTDLSTATGLYVDVTGTTDITALGTEAAGVIRRCRFTGAGLTVTHNATSLIMPGEANFRTSPNDILEFVSLGSGNWQCANIPPPLEHTSRLNADYTLTSTISAQVLLVAGQNTFTLPLGVYEVNLFICIDTMSGTSGNASFSLLGAGSATVSNPLWLNFGNDLAGSAGGGAAGGCWQANVANGGANAITAATNTGMSMLGSGTIDVTGAGTLIPSITLVTAAAAVVRRGSFIRFRLIGPSAMTKRGKVS
jgi:hypothetical protein